MTAGQFATPMAKIRYAVETLQRSWNDALQTWNDEASRNLDEQHLQIIIQSTNRILETTVAVGETMTQARRACEK